MSSTESGALIPAYTGAPNWPKRRIPFEKCNDPSFTPVTLQIIRACSTTYKPVHRRNRQSSRGCGVYGLATDENPTTTPPQRSHGIGVVGKLTWGCST
jgi:hypothetical protein